MSAEPKRTCRGDAQARCLCDAIGELLPLYAGSREDRPDSLLGEHPDPTHVTEGLKTLIDAMFPGRMFHSRVSDDEMSMFLTRRLSHAWRVLKPEIERALPFRWMGEAVRTEGGAGPFDAREAALSIVRSFISRLPAVRALLIEDVQAAYRGDPAALTFAEVQLAYPGLLAITSHRIAHELYRLDVPVLPRIMSEWTHTQTGVDINPGARIGRGFFIDHATGVVIGETTEIGDNVKLYQGVTLGARSFPVDQHGNPIKRIKRHPTVEDDVVIYANATILGGDTVIGKGSTIGGNVFLMESVPPYSFVAYRQPELKIKSGGSAGAG
jgi:serine O-acetyltransferase